MRKLGYVILAVWLVLGLTPVAAAGNDFTGAGATEIRGQVDAWKDGVIEATGTGFSPSSAGNAAQASAMARRAAIVDGYRNLLEKVGEVRVEAVTTVRNYVLESDMVKTNISGLVQGARIVNEQALPDGSYQVTLQVALFGEHSVAAAIADQMKPAAMLPVPSPSAAYQPPAMGESAPVVSGVIVDARGLGLARVMSPRIYDETGRIIYGNMYLDADFVVSHGMVDYAVNGDVAGEAASRAGTSPLVVKAIGLRDFNANVVISRTDADAILAANAKTNFFARTAVVFEQ